MLGEQYPSGPQSVDVAVAGHATAVYWTASGDGTVMSAPTAGGAPVAIATGQGSPQSVALDATSVYWANSGSGEIMKAPLAGGAAPAALATGQTAPTHIAVDSAGVFWVENGKGVSEVALTGGSVVTLSSSFTNVSALAVSGSTYYWAGDDYGQGTVLSNSGYYGSGSEWLYATNASLPCAIAVQGGYAFWTQSNTSTAVQAAPQSGYGLVTLATGPATQARTSLAVDGSSAYWTTSDGMIMKVSYSGGAPVTLATGQDQPAGLAVDDTSVYWTDPTAGTVMKLTPK